MWALKTAGVPVGNWRFGHGIGSVRGVHPTAHPHHGDVGFLNRGQFKGHQHMDLVARVYEDGTIDTIDGNSTHGRVTGPTRRGRHDFDAFFTAFGPASAPDDPVGLWQVRVGDWTWRYYFRADHTLGWSDLARPAAFHWEGRWDLGPARFRGVRVLRVTWPESAEEWDLPINPSHQTGLSLEDLAFVRAQKIG